MPSKDGTGAGSSGELPKRVRKPAAQPRANRVAAPGMGATPRKPRAKAVEKEAAAGAPAITAKTGETPAAAKPNRADSARAPLPDPVRHFGPRNLGALVPSLTRPVFRKQNPAAARIMSDWAELVGPQLAAATAPRGLSAGTLTVAASGPMAMELSHRAPQFLERINGALGQVVVQRLKVVQGLVTRRPAPPAPMPAGPPPPERVMAAIETVNDPELREALARLAKGVYRGHR